MLLFWSQGFFSLNELLLPYKIVHTALFFWGPQNQKFQKANLSPEIYILFLE